MVTMSLMLLGMLSSASGGRGWGPGLGLRDSWGLVGESATACNTFEGNLNYKHSQSESWVNPIQGNRLLCVSFFFFGGGIYLY